MQRIPVLLTRADVFLALQGIRKTTEEAGKNNLTSQSARHLLVLSVHYGLQTSRGQFSERVVCRYENKISKN
jgi:hypothetical protein